MTCHDCKLHDQCANSATYDGWEVDAEDCFDFEYGSYRQEEDEMLLAKEARYERNQDRQQVRRDRAN